jgi:TRAP-type mannitol/chloroaromatic compound transport system permease small subunit
MNGWIGDGVSWLSLVLVLVTVYDVFMRYFLREGSVAIQEAEWHLFAMNFMLAGGWTLLKAGHVRVDILYSRFSKHQKAWVDLLGSLVFCIPYCILVIFAAWRFVYDSWSILEGSPDPGGLPALYILKTVMPVAFLLVGLQAVSEAIKNALIILDKGEMS